MTGSAGETTEAFVRGIALLRGARHFEAHEELEVAWRAAAADERDFLQGLVHVAVAWYQAGRGRPIGAERQLAKAARRLRRYAPVHRDIDVAGVLDQVEEARQRVLDGRLDLDPIRL
jgi:predicted metal-dependent hydrolase